MKQSDSERGKWKRIFSLSHISDSLTHAIRRYPATAFSILVCALYMLAYEWEIIHPTNAIATAADNGFAVMILSSLVIYQWSSMFRLKPSQLYPILITGGLVSIGVFAYISLNNGVNDVERIGYSALYTALGVAILFPPDFKRRNMTSCWLFTADTFRVICVCAGIFLSLAVAAGVITYTIQLLFGINVNHMWATLNIIFAFTLSMLLLLHYLPDSILSGRHFASFDRFLSATCKNLMLPVAIIYATVLFIYGLKIITDWELPKGVICGMVTGLTCVVIPMIFGLQGYILNSIPDSRKSKIAALAFKWLPIVMVPLLMMMSVAILYRIRQYGVTVSRLYVLTFNIWAYLVMGYLYFRKSPRMNLVASSFAIIFLCVSILPGFNYSTLGVRAVQTKLVEQLKKSGVKEFPITNAQLEKILESSDQEMRVSIASDVNYLDDWNSSKFIDGIIQGERDNRQMYKYMYRSDKVADYRTISFKSVPLSPIPEGYDSLFYQSLYTAGSFKSDNDGMYDLRNNNIEVRMPIDSMASLDENVPLIPFRAEVINMDNAVYMVCEFRTDVNKSDSTNYSSFRSSGYLMKKVSQNE